MSPKKGGACKGFRNATYNHLSLLNTTKNVSFWLNFVFFSYASILLIGETLFLNNTLNYMYIKVCQ